MSSELSEDSPPPSMPELHRQISLIVQCAEQKCTIQTSNDCGKCDDCCPKDHMPLPSVIPMVRQSAECYPPYPQMNQDSEEEEDNILPLPQLHQHLAGDPHPCTDPDCDMSTTRTCRHCHYHCPCS